MPRNCKNLFPQSSPSHPLPPSFPNIQLLFWGCLFLFTASSLIQSTKLQTLRSSLTTLPLCPLFTSCSASLLRTILSFVAIIIILIQGLTKAIMECGIVGKGDDIRVMILLITLLFMSLILCHLFDLNQG